MKPTMVWSIIGDLYILNCISGTPIHPCDTRAWETKAWSFFIYKGTQLPNQSKLVVSLCPQATCPSRSKPGSSSIPKLRTDFIRDSESVYNYFLRVNQSHLVFMILQLLLFYFSPKGSGLTSGTMHCSHGMTQHGRFCVKNILGLRGQNHHKSTHTSEVLLGASCMGLATGSL